jgi:hypothetical protein
LNLDFDLLVFVQVRLQLKQLSYLCRVHLEPQLVIGGEQQLPTARHPKWQERCEVPVVQG